MRLTVCSFFAFCGSHGQIAECANNTIEDDRISTTQVHAPSSIHGYGAHVNWRYDYHLIQSLGIADVVARGLVSQTKRP